MTVRWDAHGASDRGRVRPANEDSFRVDIEEGLFVVADGMGGHAAGGLASQLAADAIPAALARERRAEREASNPLHAAIRQSQLSLADAVRNGTGQRGMGTTLTACLLGTDGEMKIGHIGDSRLYRLRDGRLEQLTRDHTWIGREVEAGRIAPDQARHHPNAHILVRSLMADVWMEPDAEEDSVRAGDVLLLCSDGLTGVVSDEEIATVLGKEAEPAEHAATLIEQANRAGGPDNITTVVVRILAGG